MYRFITDLAIATNNFFTSSSTYDFFPTLIFHKHKIMKSTILFLSLISTLHYLSFPYHSFITRFPLPLTFSVTICSPSLIFSSHILFLSFHPSLPVLQLSFPLSFPPSHADEVGRERKATGGESWGRLHTLERCG